MLQEYKDQQKHYDGHKFADCPNFVKGHVPELYVDNNRIKIRYLQCPCKIRYDEERFEAELITFIICNEILKCQIERYLYESSRPS